MFFEYVASFARTNLAETQRKRFQMNLYSKSDIHKI